ncbi:MAG TPA: maleylpyruvate isomerase N-terminal domain-containing protein [Streptosporangiaceae bacterium]|nr:maleylpyruvate isomerase N-terminal domain-containing protein [Streptosporangiaceae bacterium]
MFDDLGAEEDRLADILTALNDAQWAAPSLAAGWTVRDVMVHLAPVRSGLRATGPDGGRALELLRSYAP